jgi:F0F1-type ATP synthase membrane subunit b/b'
MESFLKNFDLVPFDVVMIAVCAILFVVLWKTLGKVLFAPYLELVEAREAATVGAEDGAKSDQARAQAITEEYEGKLMAARVAAMEKKLAAITKAKSEADSLVGKAEDGAQEMMRTIRWEMAKKMDEMRSKAFSDIDGLADMIVERVKNPAPRQSTRGSSTRSK